MLSAVVNIESADADTVLASLRPETGRELPRTHVEVRSGEGTVTLDIRAADASAMRAALNSYLECIRITEEIQKITSD
jgi:KEOPS complex subunit Pcc1